MEFLKRECLRVMVLWLRGNIDIRTDFDSVRYILGFGVIEGL